MTSVFPTSTRSPDRTPVSTTSTTFGVIAKTDGRSRREHNGLRATARRARTPPSPLSGGGLVVEPPDGFVADANAAVSVGAGSGRAVMAVTEPRDSVIGVVGDGFGSLMVY